jgi:hypothetical protein
MARLVLSLALLLAPLAATAQGQWRTVEVAKQLRETQPVRAEIEFGSGSLELEAAPSGLLYQMHVRYDEATMDAKHEYDAEERWLSLGALRKKGKVKIGGVAIGRRSHKGEQARMVVGLTRAIPLSLEIRLGGAEADLNLTGLHLQQLHITTGAGEASVSFNQLNPIEMEEMSLQVGAAGIEVKDLGNANVAEIRVQGGAGGVKLDFGEGLRRDVTINSDIALGALEVLVPEDVGISIRARTVLGGFDSSDYTKVGDQWFSENWSRATRKLTVRASTVLGGLNVRRVGR